MKALLMIVRCVENRVSSLAEATLREHVKRYVQLETLDLQVGKSYPVFGVCIREGVPWYLICEDANDEYPIPHCSSFFTLLDGRLEPGWSFTLTRSNVGECAILPDKWATDDRYLERLIDREPNAVSYFNDLKIGRPG